MKKIVLILLAVVFLFAGLTEAGERWVVIYDLDFDVEASTVEHAPEACTIKEGQGGTARNLPADCEIIVENADYVSICWNTVDDVLGTHAATDWSLLVRGINMKGDSYPPTGTDPVNTTWWEWDGLGNNQYSCNGLDVTGLYAIKLRGKTPSATVAAPSVRVKIEK